MDSHFTDVEITALGDKFEVEQEESSTNAFY